LSKSEIYLSIIGDDLEISRTMDGIEIAKGFIRSLIGKNLKIRQVPELYFYHDKNIEDGDRMVELIDRIVRDAERRKVEKSD
jgi:ribosome-binding factor A